MSSKQREELQRISAAIPVSLKRNREQCKALAKRICVILNKAESEVRDADKPLPEVRARTSYRQNC